MPLLATSAIISEAETFAAAAAETACEGILNRAGDREGEQGARIRRRREWSPQDKVAKKSSDLSSLISSRRSRKGVPASRSEVLAALLRKRAAAWRGGMSELESQLRNQILWSLPVENPENRAPANDAHGEDGDDAPTTPPAA